MIGQLNTTMGTSFAGEQRFRDRGTAFLPLILMAVAGASGFTSVRLRRLEIAAARLVGIRTRDQAIQLTIETLSWSLASSAIVLFIDLMLAIESAAFVPTVQYASLLLAGGVLSAWAGAMIGLASIKSRRALTYFKDR